MSREVVEEYLGEKAWGEGELRPASSNNYPPRTLAFDAIVSNLVFLIGTATTLGDRRPTGQLHHSFG